MGTYNLEKTCTRKRPALHQVLRYFYRRKMKQLIISSVGPQLELTINNKLVNEALNEIAAYNDPKLLVMVSTAYQQLTEQSQIADLVQTLESADRNKIRIIQILKTLLDIPFADAVAACEEHVNYRAN